MNKLISHMSKYMYNKSESTRPHGKIDYLGAPAIVQSFKGYNIAWCSFARLYVYGIHTNFIVLLFNI